MNINNSGFTSIEQVTGKYLNPNPVKQPGLNGSPEISFQEILKNRTAEQEVTQELKFSRHANERLISRQISLSEEQIERLNDGTNRARQKGIRESLIIVDDLAFIVNVKNNTVVTAVGGSDDKIFTNIDGAVVS